MKRFARQGANFLTPATAFVRLCIAACLLFFLIADDAAAQRRARAQTRPAPLTAAQILEAEERLAELGYWTGPLDGKFDDASRHALIAFQKVEGRKCTGKLTVEEIEALRAARKPKPLARGYFHVEVDLAKQVLFLVSEDDEVSHILPISSGNGKPFTSEGWTRDAITPVGRFKVQRKIDGWRKSPLGLLYYPSYYLGGLAIHGSLSVPTVPASHGCIRIPMFAAEEFSRLTPIGTPILVHNGSLTPAMEEWQP